MRQKKIFYVLLVCALGSLMCINGCTGLFAKLNREALATTNIGDSRKDILNKFASVTKSTSFLIHGNVVETYQTPIEKHSYESILLLVFLNDQLAGTHKIRPAEEPQKIIDIANKIIAATPIGKEWQANERKAELEKQEREREKRLALFNQQLNKTNSVHKSYNRKTNTHTSTFLSFQPQKIKIRVTGVSNTIYDGQAIDRTEAIQNAQRMAIEKAGVAVKSFSKTEMGVLKQDTISSTSKSSLLPGFEIIDLGYSPDGKTYRVVLIGEVKIIKQ